MSASAVTLTLSAALAASATVTVDYTAGTNPVRDVAGNKAENLSGESVTNLGPSNTAAPALAATDPAVAASRTLTLAWDKALDPAQVPAASAFSLTPALSDRRVASVAVRGDTVELGLSGPVYPCDAALAVAYTKPSENALRSVWGVAAGGFAGQAVRNARADRCQLVFEGVSVGRRQMRLRSETALDPQTPPRTDYFRVSGRSPGDGGANARSRTPAAPVAVEDARLSADAMAVVLSLSRPVAEGERLTVSYRRSSSEAGLWDAQGNQAAAFTGQAVAVGGPAVTAVAVVSDAGR